MAHYFRLFRNPFLVSLLDIPIAFPEQSEPYQLMIINGMGKTQAK